MWTFAQSTGRMLNDAGDTLATGWAGNSAGYNNPEMQNIHNVGPLPRGNYTIGSPYSNPHTGPFTMDLTPDPSNEMFGRSLFRIHGAAFSHSELSSDGCIVLPRIAREAIYDSGDTSLQVVEGPWQSSS